MRYWKLGPALALGFALLGCADEEPLGVGGPLLRGGVIRTFEVTLDAGAFLEDDTIAAGFVTPAEARFMVVASDFGLLQAHTLARFDPTPLGITYPDASGNTQQDTLPLYTGGRLLVRLDTLRSVAPGPVEFRLYQTAEEWDAATAGWDLRVDTGAVELPWATAGGSPGTLLGTGSWTPGTESDSVLISLDSTIIRAWRDTATAELGVLLVTATPGVRLHVASMSLRVSAIPSPRPDTTVTVTIGTPRAQTSLFTPQQPAPAGLRLGGVPAWRAYLTLRERLDTLTIACPDGPPGCRIALGDATVNHAALVLTPLAVPATFRPAGEYTFEARPVLAGAGLPVPRAPLADTVGRLRISDPGTVFAGGAAPVELPITRLIASLAARTTRKPGSTVALLASPEGGQFGFGAFGGLEDGVLAPRLRLILSAVEEVDLR